MNQKQTPETVYSPLFSHKIMALEPPIPVACVARAKREGGEEDELVRPFFPSSLSPYYDGCKTQNSHSVTILGFLLMSAFW